MWCSNDKVQPYVIPIHRNGFSYVKSEYKAAVPFAATVTIPTPLTINGFTKAGDYSLIITKKGKKFNERMNWTASYHVGLATQIDESKIAEKLGKWINDNPNCGLTAAVADDEITLTPLVDGEDFELTLADELWHIAEDDSIEITHAEPALNDAAYVTDLANKAAADHGIEYTYRDAYVELYPNYPTNPLKQADAEDAGFTVFTLRFAEPRAVKTVDEVVNQIVQVAFPTGASAIETFESFCASLAGKSYTSGVADTTNDAETNDADE